MSLLVRYTLKDAADHAHQVQAMADLVADLAAEGVTGVDYACYETEDPLQFIGVMDFADEAGFKAFTGSKAFEAYKARVGPTFANPPRTERMTAIASTRG